MNRKFKEKNILITVFLLLFLVSYGLFSLIFANYFITNDDLTLISIMKGTYTGTPDGHLIYVMYPLGWIFKSLYTVFPKGFWFESFTLLTHFICIPACFIRFINLVYSKQVTFSDTDLQSDIKTRKESILRRFLIILFFLLIVSIDIRFYFENQYTIISCIYAFTALFFFSSFDFSEKKSGKIGAFLFSVFCFILAFWLRKEACLMAVPFFFVILLVKLIIKKNKKSIWFSLLYLIVVSFLVLLSYLIHNNAYKSNEWKSYKEFNVQRTEMFDYDLVPEYFSNTDCYDEIGIDIYEYNAILRHNLNLVDELDTEKMKAITGRQKSVLEEWKQFYNVRNKVIKDTLKSLLRNHQSVIGIILLYVYALGLAAGFFIKTKKRKIIYFCSVFATIVYEVLFVGLFSYLGRLPERVLYTLDAICVLFIFSLICIFLQDIADGLIRNKLSRTLLSILIGTECILLIVSLIWIAKDNKSYGERKVLQDKVWSYVEQNPDNFYIIDYDIYGRFCTPVYGRYHIQPSNCEYMVDWCYKSPLDSERNRRNSLDGKVSDLCKENVYLMITEQIDTEFIVKILGENGYDTELVCVYSFDGINVLKCVEK